MDEDIKMASKRDRKWSIEARRGDKKHTEIIIK
jgi:hypothetical protein